MSTGTQTIQNAGKLLGVFSAAQPADPQFLVDAMHKLNAMIQMLESDGINLGIVPLEVPADDLGEPIDATLAIEENLAIILSPLFDNGKVIVSPDLRVNAKIHLEILRDSQPVVIPKKVVSSTLPRGAGNNRGGRRRVFSGVGTTIGK